MIRLSYLILVSMLMLSCIKHESTDTINLEGIWKFQTDPNDIGINEKWYVASLADSLYLPGSMATNGKGELIGLNTKWTGQIVDSSFFNSSGFEKYRKPENFKVPFWLQPERNYVGAAWYQKEILIPEEWKDKYIELFLERCHWETRLWLDSIEIGMRNSLGSPHVYSLSGLISPGKHILSICVDNRTKNIDVGMNSHSISDHTQSNWNGIIGKIELRKKPAVHMSEIYLFSDIKRKILTLKILIANPIGAEQTGKLKIKASPLKPLENHEISELVSSVSIDSEIKEIIVEYPMGDDVALWDEFHPNLYKIRVELSPENQNPDVQEKVFGMREIKVGRKHIEVNGKPVFLRGTLECAIFPLTGYPPTDSAEWMRIFRVAQAHGLNNIRFHSWCPPEAAFVAGDILGMYLHVECSSWANSGSSIGDGKPIDQFLFDESERIVKTFGNHPSFCIMLYGNEPAGVNQNQWLADFITHWKNKDNRRLYSGGAGWPAIPANDFHSLPEPRIQRWGEGLNSIINKKAPQSDYDWQDFISTFNKLVVSHEIGQWCVYPDFKEISQYTGVLKPRNFEIFKESLEQAKMGQLADSFLMASGKLQALCYKADIEAALRTPGFGGFQLLDLHDFPGQGTALVGVLNPFWKEKGYITPDEYKRFCNSVVPLLRLPKMIYTSDDTLKAIAEIANFGENVMDNITPCWKIVDQDGIVMFKGSFENQNIPIGNGIKLGKIVQSLNTIKRAVKLKIVLQAGIYENDWDIWVYPTFIPDKTVDILVTQTFDSKAVETLKMGGKVLLTPKKGSLKADKGGDIAVGFSSIFWNTAWTGKQAPHTLGILCNPLHPALNEFPTEYFSNWQWWDAMTHSNSIILTDFPSDLKPIVRIIDDWFTNRPLGLILEVRVGDGKLLISGIDLLTDATNRPEAQQMIFSLLRYMGSDAFEPLVQVSPELVRSLYAK